MFEYTEGAHQLNATSTQPSGAPRRVRKHGTPASWPCTSAKDEACCGELAKLYALPLTCA